MDLEPILRANLLRLARLYSEVQDVKLSTVSRFSHGDPPFYDNLAKGKPVGFTVRKYDQAMRWFRANWPAETPWPADVWEPKPPAAAPRRRLGRRKP